MPRVAALYRYPVKGFTPEDGVTVQFVRTVPVSMFNDFNSLGV
jgi:uncharacterized protein YcbX